MSTAVFRRALYSTLSNQRIRSVSCHSRLVTNASRSPQQICSIGSVQYDLSHISCYSTQSGRQWVAVDKPLNDSQASFTLMSYNILAQHYIDCQPSLYNKHDPDSLHWPYRLDALKREISDISPDVLCLQEVQQNHLAEISAHFNDLGYNTSLYKKRTGLQVDGCAIFYKQDLFDLVEFHFVDYFQPDIKILNRCNVAIIAKFAVKSNPNARFVVSTTHLLFNPKRHDIRLAQVQVLLAELDRIARHDTNHHQNVPIILTGDFNIQQSSEVFRLIVGESVRPSELFGKMKFHMGDEHRNLLPNEMGISDNCQHLDVVVHSNRYQTGLHTGVQFANSDNKTVQKRAITTEEIKTSKMPFDTGAIQHHLNLVPTICPRKPFQMDNQHASTFHNKWIMVDYIFFSEANQLSSSKLRLLENYRLPTTLDCLRTGTIPNEQNGSDHYSLAARFSIDKL